MIENKTYEHKCELCLRAVADKTNSHIIPSFIVCKTASSDGSGKRNHELVYTIGKTIQVYAGNEVPHETLERNFDDLSEERIEEELKKNTLSKDYIFCSSCEKALADYLESPYAAGKNLSAEVAYFFWMSILWRINHTEILSSKMPKFILSEVRKSLYAFLEAKKTGESTSNIQQKYPFSYRLLTCKGYSLDGAGTFYAEYDKSNRLFCMTLGDSVLCCSFNNGNLPNDFDFLGLGNEFKQAPINNGTKYEEARPVAKETFDNAYTILLGKAKDYYVKNEMKMIYGLWASLIKQKMALPSLCPSDMFVQKCLENIHNKEKKLGERYTIRNHAISFAEALKEIYGIVVKNDLSEKL